MVETTDVQTAVDRLAGDLGQSVLIEDERQKPLWWSAQGAVDGTRATTIMQRRVAPLPAAGVNQFLLLDATPPPRTPAPPPADMWGPPCVPRRPHRRPPGYPCGL